MTSFLATAGLFFHSQNLQMIGGYLLTIGTPA